MSAASGQALAQRRIAIKSRLDAQRYAIGAAWSHFAAAAARNETRARRAIVWTRRIAGVAIIVGAVRALQRRPATKPGLVGRTIGTVAVLQKYAKMLRLAGWTPRSR